MAHPSRHCCLGEVTVASTDLLDDRPVVRGTAVSRHGKGREKKRNRQRNGSEEGRDLYPWKLLKVGAYAKFKKVVYVCLYRICDETINVFSAQHLTDCTE